MQLKEDTISSPTRDKGKGIVVDLPNKAATRHFFRCHKQGHIAYKRPRMNLLVGLHGIVQKEPPKINCDHIPEEETSDANKELEVARD